MPSPTQQFEEERRWLNGFLLRSNVMPGAIVTRPIPDPPDAVLEQGSRRVPVEVTRVFVDGGAELRRGNSDQDWTCREVEKLLSTTNIQPLHVTLGFSHDHLLVKRSEVARSIVREIVRNDPSDDQLKTLDWRDDDFVHRRRGGWPQDVEYLMLLRPTGWPVFEVARGGAGWELTKCQGVFQAAIDRKASDLPGYRDGYSEAWLLLVAEGHDTASFIEPDQATRAHVFTSPFDRCFFYRHHFGGWCELRRANAVSRSNDE
ncbi:MAG: hypothetical protein ABL886_10850 [Rhodoglobus sp.]